jgi:hypothetical protein
MTPRTSHDGEKENHAREKPLAAANRDWMSENILSERLRRSLFT